MKKVSVDNFDAEKAREQAAEAAKAAREAAKEASIAARKAAKRAKQWAEPQYEHAKDWAGPRYEQAKVRQDERRPRKLLLHRREIDRLIGKTAEQGLTLVPVRIYLSHGLVKLELGLGRGKRRHEKRAAIAEREHNREMERNLGRRR